MQLYSCPDEMLFNLHTCRSSDAKREWRKMVKDKWGNQCAYCGSTEELTIDHVVASAMGGSNLVHNTVCCCKKCNQSKGLSDVWEWYENQDFFTEARKKSIQDWVKMKPKEKTTYRYKPRKNAIY